MLNISLQSEYVASVYGLKVTNSFLTSVVVTLVLSVMAILFYMRVRSRKEGARGGVLIESLRVVVYELMKLTDSVTQDRKLTKRILPLIATFFLFIITANLMGMIPGFLGSFYVQTASGNLPLFRSANSDLTTTLALAIFSVLSIQYFSFTTLGPWKFFRRFVNLASPVAFFEGFFEIISETVKVLSFSFRLFGNIFAGEVLLLVIAFLVPYILPLPFMILEIFVGVIQAFIFAVLTLTFIETSIVRYQKPEETPA